MNSAQAIHLQGTRANSGKKSNSINNQQASQSEMQQTLKNLGQALADQSQTSAHASRERKEMHSTIQFDMKKMARIGAITSGNSAHLGSAQKPRESTLRQFKSIDRDGNLRSEALQQRASATNSTGGHAQTQQQHIQQKSIRTYIN